MRLATLAIALLAGCAQPGTVSVDMGQQVAAPFGYVGFCVRNPSECEGGTDAPQAAVITPEKWAEINKVNDYVNSAIPQVSDAALYDRDEWWAYPDALSGKEST